MVCSVSYVGLIVSSIDLELGVVDPVQTIETRDALRLRPATEHYTVHVRPQWDDARHGSHTDTLTARAR